jgi:ADP-heptose:LPS heptosyltransferase
MFCDVPWRTYMKLESGWWLVPGDRSQGRQTHATEHYYNRARELGLPTWEAVDHHLQLRLPMEARQSAQTFLCRAGESQKALHVAMHPGDAMLDGIKRWPAERFAEVADALQEGWGARVVLLGGADDGELTEAVGRAMRSRPLVATGEVSLRASLALVDLASLLIGNDSGLLHAAAALGAPCIGICGPTSPANFQPVPSYPGQGRLVLPWAPCRPPRHFVGGDVIWHPPCCEETCDTLLTVGVNSVLGKRQTSCTLSSPRRGQGDTTGRRRALCPQRVSIADAE